MSGKLNQSLEEILKDKRSSGPRTGRGGRPRRGAKATTTKVAAPAGGIKKNTRPTRNAAKQAPAKGAKGSRGSVIQIGNLPRDASETQIKEYFLGLNKDGFIGDVKRVECQYGPPPASVPKGVVQVTFVQSDAAYKTLTRLKDIKIDGRLLDLKVLVTGDAVPEPLPLSQRITNAPKSAAAGKAGGKNAKTAPVSGAKGAGAGAGAGKKGRGGKPKNARPAKKTAEELDAEMTDYFGSAKDSTEVTGAASAGGDAQMEDEIM